MTKITQIEAIKLIAKGKQAWNDKLDELRGPYNRELVNIQFNDYNFDDFNFDGYDLDCNITFNNCKFRAENLFPNVKTIGMLMLRDCNKLGNIDFRNATIKSILIDHKNNNVTELKGFSVSGKSTITGTITLHNLYIEGGFSLQGINQLDNRNYRPVIDLYKCTIDNDVYLNESNFNVIFQMHTCTFNDRFIAKNSEFHSRAKFTNCIFKGLTDFRGTIFRRPPHFDGAELHTHTLFPSESYFQITKLSNNDDIDEDIEAVRNLRQHCSKLLDRKLQGLFYSLEQKYRQVSGQMSRSEYFFSKAYQYTSDFGRSLTKPALWSLSLFLVFTLIYCLLKKPPEPPNYYIPHNLNLSSFYESIIESLQNTFIPFRNLAKANSDSNLFIVIVGSFHSILSAWLISSFLIAIRWTFKKD